MKKLPENADSISGSFFVESEIEPEGLNRKDIKELAIFPYGEYAI